MRKIYWPWKDKTWIIYTSCSINIIRPFSAWIIIYVLYRPERWWKLVKIYTILVIRHYIIHTITPSKSNRSTCGSTNIVIWIQLITIIKSYLPILKECCREINWVSDSTTLGCLPTKCYKIWISSDINIISDYSSSCIIHCIEISPEWCNNTSGTYIKNISTRIATIATTI